MKVNYAIAAFHSVYKLKLFDKPTYFDDHTFVVTSTISSFIEPDVLDSQWAEWIGSLQLEELNKSCDTLLVSWQKTSTPGDLDNENQKLNSRLFEIVRALPAITSYCFAHNDYIYVLSGQGEFNNNKLIIKDIQEYSAWPTFNRPMFLDTNMTYECPFFNPKTFADDWICLTKQIDKKILSEKNRQLIESYRSIEESFRTNQLEFKIPNLVRAIECLIDCNGALDFSKKVVKFIGTPKKEEVFFLDTNYREKLRTLYQLRNDCFHGKEFGWSLQNKPNEVFDKKTVAGYECLAEWVARKAFHRAMFDDSLGDMFANRENLITGWKQIETGLLKKKKKQLKETTE